MYYFKRHEVLRKLGTLVTGASAGTVDSVQTTSMKKGSTVVLGRNKSLSKTWRWDKAPVHKQWSCCGLALSHRYRYPAYWTSLNVHGSCPAIFYYYDYVIGYLWMWPDYPYSSGVHRWHWADPIVVPESVMWTKGVRLDWYPYLSTA